jgi:hypothetical protein
MTSDIQNLQAALAALAVSGVVPPGPTGDNVVTDSASATAVRVNGNGAATVRACLLQLDAAVHEMPGAAPAAKNFIHLIANEHEFLIAARIPKGA